MLVQSVEEWRREASDLEAAGEDAAAIDAWRRVLDEDPNDLIANDRVGLLLKNSGQRTDAIPHLRRAAEITPGSIKRWRRLACALDVVGLSKQGRFDALDAWRRVLAIEPDNVEAHERCARILFGLKRKAEAVEHVKHLGGGIGADEAAVMISEKNMFFEQDGKIEKGDYGYYRGEHTNFYPRDESLDRPDALESYFVYGLMPAAPPLGPTSRIVAFGSCFAAHISNYLAQIGYNITTRKESAAYINKMGDGMVNSHAIRQQFEWAWLGKQPEVELWHGYDEEVRLATRALFDAADAFVITLGLSEVWYDEPTGEVFWRAVPKAYFDPARHRFRVVPHRENYENIVAIYRLIRERKPEATIVFTLSPIPLTATFRPLACTVADSASKASLRSALDDFLREAEGKDANLYYFPSYEIALRAFDHPYIEDRKHVHKHVLDLNMAIFERYFCQTGKTDEELSRLYGEALALDRRVQREGNESVPRKM